MGFWRIKLFGRRTFSDSACNSFSLSAPTCTCTCTFTPTRLFIPPLAPHNGPRHLKRAFHRYLTKETRKAAAKEVLARRSPPRLQTAHHEPIRRDRDVNFAPQVKRGACYSCSSQLTVTASDSRRLRIRRGF